MPSKVYLIFGDAGTGKTTAALSGTGRKWYAELDAGSFSRATASLDPGDVTVNKYYAPLTGLTDLGKVSGAGIAHRYQGWQEIYWKFVEDYLNALKGDYSTLILDTSTKAWLMIRNAFLQRVQEEKNDKERERLSRLEYQEPNSQFGQIIEGAKIQDKNLVLLAHEGEVYLADKPTGQMKPDGNKEANMLADVTLRFQLKNRIPVATIHKAGIGGLGLIGLEIPEPTLGSISDLIDGAAKLRKMGFQVPNTYQDLIDTIKALEE